MALHSIDYLNARRALMPATGGKTYARVANPVDQRARDNASDALDLAHDAVHAIFADFRKWFAASTNALHAASISPELADNGEAIPF